jgi:hypothetical protein
MLPCGRRSGKTELFKRKLSLWAVSAHVLLRSYPPPWKFFAAAPTRDQAKRIYWQDLKLLIPKTFLLCPPSESELSIRLINGAELWVLGMDKPERAEGSYWDGGGLDEYGNMKEDTWGAHIRPTLSERGGWCDFLGVPEGRGHYFQTYQKCKVRYAAALEAGQVPVWNPFHWISAEVLPPEEIAAAREDLDELTYLQEYEASFVTFQGRAYYAFGDYNKGKVEYDPKREIGVCFDFNVSPGVAAVVQEQIMPGSDIPGTGVIWEAWIQTGSNTIRICDRIKAAFKGHQGPVVCYGDATGGAKGTAKVLGTDWELIKRSLGEIWAPEEQLFFNVPRMNPSERERVNAVNSRCRSVSGSVRLMVDETKCPHVVEDFEGVTVDKKGSGAIEKKDSPMLTHLSDAIGYYINRLFPIHSREVALQEV